MTLDSGFDDVRLDANIEQGAQGGPRFLTTVLIFSSGKERRNQGWQVAKCAWDIGYGIQMKSDYQTVRSFFYARRGRLRGFRFKDWLDYQVSGGLLGTGDGATTAYQLQALYSDAAQTYTRKITRPVASDPAPIVYVNGTPVSYTLGAAGIVTLGAAPTSGAAVTADFQFDVPVRFDVDTLPVTSQFETTGQITGIQIVELPE